MTVLRSNYLKIAGVVLLVVGLALTTIFVVRSANSVRKGMRGIFTEFNNSAQRQLEQAESLKRIEAKIDAVSAKMTDEFASLNAKIGDEPVDAGTRARKPGLSWSVIDGVDIYQKAGRLEFYGMSVDQRRQGAVSSNGMVINTRSPNSWLVWKPAFEPIMSPHSLTLEFAPGSTAAGTITVLIALSNNTFVRFPVVLGMPIPGGTAGEAAKPPQDVLDAFAASGQEIQFRQITKLRYTATLPRSLVTLMDTSRGEGFGIKFISIKFEHPTPASYAIRSLRFDGTSPVDPESGVDLSGMISGYANFSGTKIDLIDIEGNKRSVEPALDGSYSFAGVPANVPVSLRYRHQGRDYYATLGRWFLATDRQMLTEIKVIPEFPNPSAAPPNKADINLSGETSTDDGKLPFRYTPNSRTSWPGAGPVQEFAGLSFANSEGMLDRDRQVFNRDRCLRVFAVGGSTYVSLQVSLNEKFNTILEAELGQKLNRCVEVISSGRDNGDIGAIYTYIRDYGAKFDPDVILIEHMTALAMQMGPELLLRTQGYKYENSVLDNFYFDGEGKLTHRKWDPSWALDAVKPSGEPLIPNLNIWHTMNIPYADFPKEARDSFHLAEAILNRIKAENPRAKIVIATGRDQAGCVKSGLCDGTFTMPDGRIVPMGIRTALENFSGLCERASVSCLHPPIPQKGTPDESGLLYEHDGHYSVKGHQWLARHLAVGLEPILRNIKAISP